MRAGAQPTVKGGTDNNGEEDGGREKEGRQEAVSQPDPYEKGGDDHPLFLFQRNDTPSQIRTRSIVSHCDS